MRYDPEREQEVRLAFRDLAAAIVQLMDAAREPGLAGGRLTDATKELGEISARIYRVFCDDAP